MVNISTTTETLHTDEVEFFQASQGPQILAGEDHTQSGHR